MKQSILRASVTGAIAAMFIAAPQAYAKGKPGGGGSTPPDNVDEWKLINVIGSDGNGSYNYRTSIDATGVAVGLFDGLTDCRHVDLTGHCEYNLISGGHYRFYDSHGTHTAGIIAGNKTGVAPGAKIINYAVFDDSRYVATGTKLIDSWNAAFAKDATIASMSFGCTGTALCFTADEVTAMTNTPMLYVKAAGNDSVALANESVAVSQATAQAALARLILVGSVDVPSSGVATDAKMSSYSNTAGNGCLLYSGITTCGTDTLWKDHFLVAPGTSIYSTLPGNNYGLMSGTSMATPMVSGAAALIEATWPTLTPQQVASILLTTATDLGAPGVDSTYGHGLLNVRVAMSPVGGTYFLSTGGGSTTTTSFTVTQSSTFGGLPKVLASVPVYDGFGRDFPLAQTGRLQLRRTYDGVHRLLGRQLLGLGSQEEWASAYFADKHLTLGVARFGSAADPVASAFLPDKSMRMGFDMPFKGGVAQLRMTGSSSTREDFAYDPSLKPLSFFASTALLKSSMFGQALFNIGQSSRLAVYGTTNATGAIMATAPGEPVLLQHLGERSTARLALTGLPNEQRQYGFGLGYWTRPDRHTVIGVNVSYLVQNGGYYDMASTLDGLDGTTRLFNLGAVVSRALGSWEVSAAGEISHVSMSGGTSEIFSLTPANIVSAELRLRKAGVAFGGGELADSLSVALVMPPRAVSGTLRLDYMGPTADRLDLQPYHLRLGLGDLDADPVKVEAGYRLTGGSGWTLDLSGGVNLRQSDYAGRGEALASFHMGF